MHDRCGIWLTLQRLKERRSERTQERLNDCRRAAEQAERAYADRLQEHDACKERLVACDQALADKASAGQSIGIQSIVEHQRFRAVLEERYHAAAQPLTAASQALHDAREEVAATQLVLCRLQTQAEMCAEKAAKAWRMVQAECEAAEEEEAIEALLALRSYRALHGAEP
ncbi:serine kinase [Xanthomonas sp. NCPPB 1638]|uniref:serine kinase n=1 Tax=Xanthomonas TaxID=338 RepID=UPI00132ED6C8|nr:serine kinase [Xanthomonas cucurbitae]QHG88371.1 serine kinase [Xanthomonas cucurbitae]WDM74938.1 serine kinase [Xanthomonas cucurbitae]